MPYQDPKNESRGEQVEKAAAALKVTVGKKKKRHLENVSDPVMRVKDNTADKVHEKRHSLANQLDKLNRRPSENKLPVITGHYSARSIGSDASLDGDNGLMTRIST